MKLKICCLILTVAVLCSCSAENDTYVIPVDYTGEAVMKVYTNKSENAYRVSIICRDNNYSIRMDSGKESWNTAYLSGSRCVLSNDKFPDGSVTIENFHVDKMLVHDFDLGKFDNSSDALTEEIIYWDGTYKHVLNFNNENLLPGTIFIYKNDILVKAIEYENIKIEK